MRPAQDPDPPQGDPGRSVLGERLARGLAEVRARITAAARATGRSASPPTLLPVTKSVDAATTAALAALLRDAPAECAENRAQDLEHKAAALAAAGVAVRWHFIGHIQRNKARRIVRSADVVHSVDSLRLAETLADAAEAEGKVLDVYVQVDFTGEPTKSGLDADGAYEVLRFVAGSSSLRPLGLMAMGPREERPGATTPEVFARVAALAGTIEADPNMAGVFAGGRVGLSLGMSGDLEDAVAAGSTLLRIGSDLFQYIRDTTAANAAHTEGPSDPPQGDHGA
ncbi:MAG: YggS family pyridoxal phosphate-dependent enzyme [Planctomycetota bacterium]